MDKLPPEIISLIVSVLRSDRSVSRMGPYACISRKFQQPIERENFAKLSLDARDLDSFSRILQHQPQRGAALRYIVVSITLPTYDDAKCAFYESIQDRHQNNVVFTQTFQDLFEILRSHDHHDRLLSISVRNISSPTDFQNRPESEKRRRWKATTLGQREDIFEQRYAHSYLELIEPVDLPSLDRVRILTVTGCHSRYIAPSVLVLLASRCPRLLSFEGSFADTEKRLPSLRRRLRTDFALSLLHLAAPMLNTVLLNHRHVPPLNQSLVNNTLSSHHHRTETADHFSRRLGHFLQSHALTAIMLAGPISIDASLFLPPEGNTHQPMWPTLKFFCVDFSLMSPKGDWYFDEDPASSASLSLADVDSNSDNDEDSDQEVDDNDANNDNDNNGGEGEDDNDNNDGNDKDDGEQVSGNYNPRTEARITGMYPRQVFRTWPGPELEPLLCAAAYAASQMPRITLFTAVARLVACARTNWSDFQKFGFEFVAPGQDVSEATFHDLEGPYARMSIWQPPEYETPPGSEDALSLKKGLTCLTWRSPKGWRMSEELASSWAKVLGPDSLVRYLEW